MNGHTHTHTRTGTNTAAHKQIKSFVLSWFCHNMFLVSCSHALNRLPRMQFNRESKLTNFYANYFLPFHWNRVKNISIPEIVHAWFDCHACSFVCSSICCKFAQIAWQNVPFDTSTNDNSTRNACVDSFTVLERTTKAFELVWCKLTAESFHSQLRSMPYTSAHFRPTLSVVFNFKNWQTANIAKQELVFQIVSALSWLNKQVEYVETESVNVAKADTNASWAKIAAVQQFNATKGGIRTGRW